MRVWPIQSRQNQTVRPTFLDLDTYGHKTVWIPKMFNVILQYCTCSVNFQYCT